MLSAAVCVVTLLIICITHWTYKWRNPRCNGKLPLGSMGLPLIGETIQYFSPGNSIDTHPFVKKRLQRYGPIFKTSLVGRPVVISADPDFNHFIFQQEGKLVEFWYLDSFAKLVLRDPAATATGYIHKYLRGLVLNHFGLECLREKLLPEFEQMIRRSLHIWSTKESVEVKRAISSMIFVFTSKMMYGFDPQKFSGSDDLSDKFTHFLQGIMSFPLNVPGTTFHRCLKNQKMMIQIMRDLLHERRASPEKRRGDFLDQVIEDMKTETFLNEEFVVYMMFGLLIATFETISSTLTLAIILLTDHPTVVDELKKEHEAILRNREHVDSPVTWKEYKSMSFTQHVINETLRMASVTPGMLRKVTNDIQVNGYTIPKGWTILVVASAVQMNPNAYKDPLQFNPWRWQHLGVDVTAKNFIAFGGGMRSCAGSEFTRVLKAIFLHIFVTKYMWKKVKGGDVVRNPGLGFGDGFHIKVSEK